MVNRWDINIGIFPEISQLNVQNSGSRLNDRPASSDRHKKLKITSQNSTSLQKTESTLHYYSSIDHEASAPEVCTQPGLAKLFLYHKDNITFLARKQRIDTVLFLK